jgi:hypothetical protein
MHEIYNCLLICGEAGGALVLFVCTLGMWRGWWCSCPVCLYFGYVERLVVLLSCLFVLWVCGEAGGALTSNEFMKKKYYVPHI